MQIFAETKRLILRELLPSDELGMFELDSDKDVHRFLGNQPLEHIDQVKEIIKNVRQQYIDNGIGRWAVIEKETNQFIGWAGLKLIKELTNNHIYHYDLGYRLIKKYWGKGYATESASAALDYGFENFGPDCIYAMTHVDNKSSGNVLKKIGFKYIETFDYNDSMIKNWYQITREEWKSLKAK
jgi:ribosomal-protein-alanine N-acetyltransferase